MSKWFKASKIMVDETKLKVKPPIDQNAAKGVDGLKIQGEFMVTAPDRPVKLPEGAVLTTGVIQPITSDAVFALSVFICAPPLNPMLPVIGTAWAIPPRETMAATATVVLSQLV